LGLLDERVRWVRTYREARLHGSQHPLLPQSPEQEWGTFVHNEFENYLSIKPENLADMAARKSGHK
jgi:hypothetical protein